MAEILRIKDVKEINKFSESKDILKALAYVSEFWDVHCCTIVKDEIPTGVGLSAMPYDAKIKALDCNPVAAIGATIAFSKEIDKETAKSLYRMNFGTIIASDIHKEAKKYLEKCQSRVIELGFRLESYKKVLNENTLQELTPKGFKVATKVKPTQEQIEDMVFAWKILKTIDSEAIVIVKDFKTRSIEKGIGLEAVERAMDNACDGSKEAILAISENISNPKFLHAMIQGRIIGIIEPRNYENKDAEVLKMAEKYGITVVTVGEE